MACKTPDRIADLLVHVGRAARSEESRSDLTATQWACLRFFAAANGSTRTPSGFACFQATTRGTASQIIKSLERRGLIQRHRSVRDRRSVRFDLTETGRATLQRDPLGDLIHAIDRLDWTERAPFLSTLSRLASVLSGLRNVPAFGTCRDCSHFTPKGDHGYCACMAETLSIEEIDKLCASHHSASHESQTEGDHDDRA